MIAAVALSASLVAQLSRAGGVAACAAEAGESAAMFARNSFDVRGLTLYDGTRVTLAVSKASCLARNAVVRVLAYAHARDGERLVLDDYSLPEQISAQADGTVGFATHETVEIVDQSTYVWNGQRYVFSPERSQRYDVAIGQGRPYVVRVRFAPGTSSSILKGSISGGFGDDYEVAARAGQRVSVRVVKGWSKNLRFDVYQDSNGGASARVLTSLEAARAWSAILPANGTWKIGVFGADEMDHQTTSPYTIVVTII